MCIHILNPKQNMSIFFITLCLCLERNLVVTNGFIVGNKNKSER